MIHSNKTKESGFIALMTAMILSLILMLITVALNQSGFFARSTMLEAEYKERSSALAEACANTALLKLANDPGYAGNETVTTASSFTDTCKIRPVKFNIPASGKNTIETQGKFREATTDLQVVVSASSVSVLSWAEPPHF